MSFFVPCIHEHAFLSCPNPSWFFPALSENPLLGSGNSKVSQSSLFLGFLGAPFKKDWTKLFLLFLPSLRPRTCPFIGLSFILLILNESQLTDWTFLIFEGPFALGFNTCNILDLNNYQTRENTKNYLYIRFFIEPNRVSIHKLIFYT